MMESRKTLLNYWIGFVIGTIIILPFNFYGAIYLLLTSSGIIILICAVSNYLDIKRKEIRRMNNKKWGKQE